MSSQETDRFSNEVTFPVPLNRICEAGRASHLITEPGRLAAAEIPAADSADKLSKLAALIDSETQFKCGFWRPSGPAPRASAQLPEETDGQHRTTAIKRRTNLICPPLKRPSSSDNLLSFVIRRFAVTSNAPQ